MGSVTLNTRAERRKPLNKNTQNKSLHSNDWNEEEHISTRTEKTGSRHLKNVTAYIDSLNKNMTEMIQQSAMRRAKQTKKQKKPKISSHTSLTALITERRIPKTRKEANNARTRNRRCVHRNPEIHNIFGQLSNSRPT